MEIIFPVYLKENFNRYLNKDIFNDLREEMSETIEFRYDKDGDEEKYEGTVDMDEDRSENI